MENIRLIETAFGEYRIQHGLVEAVSDDNGIQYTINCHWVNRWEDTDLKRITDVFKRILDKGLPAFFGTDFYTTLPKRVILDDYCEMRDDYDWISVLGDKLLDKEILNNLEIKIG